MKSKPRPMLGIVVTPEMDEMEFYKLWKSLGFSFWMTLTGHSKGWKAEQGKRYRLIGTLEEIDE